MEKSLIQENVTTNDEVAKVPVEYIPNNYEPTLHFDHLLTPQPKTKLVGPILFGVSLTALVVGAISAFIVIQKSFHLIFKI